MIKNYSKLIIFGSIGLIVAVGAIMYVTSSNKAVEYETTTVERGTVVETVSVTGSIAPSSKIRLEPEVSGQVKEILVEEGDEVEEGDVLVRLDSGEIGARVQAQRASLNSAIARLRELEAGATPQEIVLKESAVDTAQSRYDAAVAAEGDAHTALDNADKNLANVTAKADTLSQSKIDVALHSFEDADASATDAVTRLTSPLFTSDNQLTFTSTDSASATQATHTRSSAKSAITRITSNAASVNTDSAVETVLSVSASITTDLLLVKEHLVADIALLDHAAGLTSTTLATYQQNTNTALNSVNTALQMLSADKSNLDLQQKLNDADITTAEIGLSNAQAAVTAASFSMETAKKSLAQAQADLDLLKAGTRKEVVDSQRARVDLEQANLNGLLTDYAKRQITAPVSGIVTLVAAELGEIVGPGKAAVILNTVGMFEITANISEIDIAKVSVGDEVHITLDAFSRDEAWTGTVIAIQPAEKVVEGIIFYETTVRFNTDDPRLRSGMTANLDIETARSEDTLMVSFRAVRDLGDKVVVDRLDNGFPVETVVTLGLENDDSYEITSGLSEGDIVVVAELRN